MIIESPQPLLT